MLVDRVIHTTFVLIAARANSTHLVFAPLACAIHADLAVGARSPTAASQFAHDKSQ
jgi:hypothetical protein